MNKPEKNQYAEFYYGYIDRVTDGQVLTTLERSKDISYNLFYNLSDDKANYAYADGKWTVKQVVGHLIDAERTFAYRALAFSRGQAELPGFDENVYVEKATFNNRSIQSLADELRLLREANLYLIRSLNDEQYNAIGIANGNPISVAAIVYIMAGHELHHLHILKERYLIG